MIPVPLIGGLDTRSHPKGSQGVVWQQLENVDIDQVGAFVKRPGYRCELGNEDATASGNFGHISGHTYIKTSPFNGGRTYFSTSKVGNVDATVVAAGGTYMSRGFGSRGYDERGSDFLHIGTTSYFATCGDGDTSVVVEELDARGRTKSFSSTSIAATASAHSPRLVSRGGTPQLFAYRTGSSPSLLTADATGTLTASWTNAIGSISAYDAVALRIAGPADKTILYGTAGGATSVGKGRLFNGTSSSATVLSSTSTATQVSVCTDGVSDHYVVWVNPTNGVRASKWLTTGAARWTDRALIATATDAQRVTCFEGNGTLYVAVERPGASDRDDYVQLISIDDGGATSTVGSVVNITLQHCGIASRMFGDYDDSPFLLLGHKDSKQNTYFIFRVIGGTLPQKINGVFAPGIAAGYRDSSGSRSVICLPQIAPHYEGSDYTPTTNSRANTYSCALPVLASLPGEDDKTGEIYSEHRSNLFSFIMSHPVAVSGHPRASFYPSGTDDPLIMGGALNREMPPNGFASIGGRAINSGMISAYLDPGRSMHEMATWLIPQGTSGTWDSGSGSVATGTYNYRFYYVRQMSDGSELLSDYYQVTLTATTATGNFGFTIPSIMLTKTPEGATHIRSFRTKQGETEPYFQVSSLDPTTSGTNNGWISNDTSTATISWEDHLADSDIGDNPLDLKSLGLVRPSPIPASSLVAAGAGRVWTVSAEDPTVIYYTTLASGLSPPQWHSGNIVRTGLDQPITALRFFGGSLLIFTRTDVHAMPPAGAGNAETDTREQPLPSVIAPGVGCELPQSITASPGAVYYASDDGIYVIDGGLGVTLVSNFSPEFWNRTRKRISASSRIGGETKVCWSFGDSPAGFSNARAVNALVYNYALGAWTTYANVTNVGTATDANEITAMGVFEDRHIIITSGETRPLYRTIDENSNEPYYRTVYTTSATQYDMTLKTNFFSLGSIAEDFYCESLHISGNAGGSCSVRYQVFVDGNEATASVDSTATVTSSGDFTHVVDMKQRRVRNAMLKIIQSGTGSVDSSFEVHQLGIYAIPSLESPHTDATNERLG